MRRLNQYQCEICNTLYESEEDCKTCEKSHACCISIKQEVFNSYKNDGGIQSTLLQK